MGRLLSCCTAVIPAMRASHGPRGLQRGMGRFLTVWAFRGLPRGTKGMDRRAVWPAARVTPSKAVQGGLCRRLHISVTAITAQALARWCTLALLQSLRGLSATRQQPSSHGCSVLRVSDFPLIPTLGAGSRERSQASPPLLPSKPFWFPGKRRERCRQAKRSERRERLRFLLWILLRIPVSPVTLFLVAV